MNSVLRAIRCNENQIFGGGVNWEAQQMRTSACQMPGSWIRYNGYAVVAFDGAQLCRFQRARVALVRATQQGVGSVLIGWVRREIDFLQ